MEKVRQERGACEARRERLEQQFAYLDKAALYKTGVQEFAKRVAQGLDAMDFGQRRDLLRLLVEHLVYDNHEVPIRALIPAPPSDDRRLRQLPRGGQGSEGPTAALAPSRRRYSLISRLAMNPPKVPHPGHTLELRPQPPATTMWMSSGLYAIGTRVSSLLRSTHLGQESSSFSRL